MSQISDEVNLSEYYIDPFQPFHSWANNFQNAHFPNFQIAVTQTDLKIDQTYSQDTYSQPGITHNQTYENKQIYTTNTSIPRQQENPILCFSTGVYKCTQMKDSNQCRVLDPDNLTQRDQKDLSQNREYLKKTLLFDIQKYSRSSFNYSKMKKSLQFSFNSKSLERRSLNRLSKNAKELAEQVYPRLRQCLIQIERWYYEIQQQNGNTLLRQSNFFKSRLKNKTNLKTFGQKLTNLKQVFSDKELHYKFCILLQLLPDYKFRESMKRGQRYFKKQDQKIRLQAFCSQEGRNLITSFLINIPTIKKARDQQKTAYFWYFHQYCQNMEGNEAFDNFVKQVFHLRQLKEQEFE